MVDEATANPVVPMQRRVPDRRPEHISAHQADANPPLCQSALAEFVAKLRQQRRDVLAEQIPPGLQIEFVAEDVDAASSKEIRAHWFVEAELITVFGRPRLRTEAEEEAVEAR